MKNSLKSIGAFALALVLFTAATAMAEEAVKVSNAWVRATMPGQKVAGAYMELQSAAGAVLVAAHSPVAGFVEIHFMTMEAGVMKMRPVERLGLPAGKTVKLEPGGIHLMLVNIKKPLRQGEKVPLTLIVEKADKTGTEVKVEAEVLAVGRSGRDGH